MTKLNPKTGKPVNEKHGRYGRPMPVKTKVKIAQAIKNLPDEKFDHIKKKCYLVHMSTKMPIQFDSIVDACKFLGITPFSSTSGAMVKTGKYKEWYFHKGVYGEYKNL